MVAPAVKQVYFKNTSHEGVPKSAKRYRNPFNKFFPVTTRFGSNRPNNAQPGNTRHQCDSLQIKNIVCKDVSMECGARCEIYKGAYQKSSTESDIFKLFIRGAMIAPSRPQTDLICEHKYRPAVPRRQHCTNKVVDLFGLSLRHSTKMLHGYTIHANGFYHFVTDV